MNHIKQRFSKESIFGQILNSPRVLVGGGILLLIFVLCLITLPLTLTQTGFGFDTQNKDMVRAAPQVMPAAWFGYDALGRSILGRCLLGGSISLAVGLGSALISVSLGVTVGLFSGYLGGWVDTVLMRLVDILDGLPYILLVILFKIAIEEKLANLFHSPQAANLVLMFLAIGLVSWLTMARVVRGQVLSIRSMPYIEACRAMGVGQTRIFWAHVLPNLIGPIIVYATLTIPGAILQESFLSFLGVGVKLPMPTWGSLASEGIMALSPIKFYWWMLIFPCALLMLTLLSLNFMGDGLRDVLDPKKDAAKI